jgi:hypothetical protein
MKRINRIWVIGILLSAMGLSRIASADVNEETQLKDAQAVIDQHAAVWSKDQHIDTLAKHFNLPAKSVLALSSQNQGWGAVTIELAMAKQYSTLHSQKSALMTDSVARVESLRAEGKTWGDISRKLEFGLGPVIQEAKNTGEGLRQDDLKLTQKIDESAKVEENRRIIKEEHTIAEANRADRR